MNKIVTMIVVLLAIGASDVSFGMTVGRDKLQIPYNSSRSSRSDLPKVRHNAFHLPPVRAEFKGDKPVVSPFIVPSEIVAKNISEHADQSTLLNLRATSRYCRGEIRVEKLDTASSYLRGERALLFMEKDLNNLKPGDLDNNSYLVYLFDLVDKQTSSIDESRSAKKLLVEQCIPADFDRGFYRYMDCLVIPSAHFRRDQGHKLDLLRAAPHGFNGCDKDDPKYSEVVRGLHILASDELFGGCFKTKAQIKEEHEAIDRRAKEYEDIFFGKS